MVNLKNVEQLVKPVKCLKINEKKVLDRFLGS